MRIEVTWSPASERLISGKRMQRALLSAVRKAGGDALRHLRAETKRQVRQRVRIRAGYLANASLPLHFPRSTTRLQDLEWRMDVSGRSVPLGEYPRRQTRRGVSLEVIRGRRVLLESAFLARRKTGRDSVFLRPSAARYPMGHRLGLNVADTLKDGRIAHGALYSSVRVMRSAFERLFKLE